MELSFGSSIFLFIFVSHKRNKDMSLTITKSWKLNSDPKSTVLLISLKSDLATLSVRNTLDEPKAIYLAVHTFRLDNPNGFKKLYSEASEYLNQYYMKDVQKFVESHLHN